MHLCLDRGERCCSRIPGTQLFSQLRLSGRLVSIRARLRTTLSTFINMTRLLLVTCKHDEFARQELGSLPAYGGLGQVVRSAPFVLSLNSGEDSTFTFFALFALNLKTGLTSHAQSCIWMTDTGLLYNRQCRRKRLPVNTTLHLREYCAVQAIHSYPSTSGSCSRSFRLSAREKIHAVEFTVNTLRATLQMRSWHAESWAIVICRRIRRESEQSFGQYTLCW